MAYKYENHGKIFKEEKDRADQYEKLYTALKQPYDDIKKEAQAGRMDAAKIMARDLVRTRGYIKKMHKMKCFFKIVLDC